MTELIDCTPVGLSTPDGIARVKRAEQALYSANAEAAHLLAMFVDAEFSLDDEDYPEFRQAVDDCRAASDEFLRAVAGAPAR
jgi:hypothetical protein